MSNVITTPSHGNSAAQITYSTDADGKTKQKGTNRKNKFILKNIHLQHVTSKPSEPGKARGRNNQPRRKSDHAVSVIGIRPPRIIRKKKIKIVIDNTTEHIDKNKRKNGTRGNIRTESDYNPSEFSDVATSEILPNSSQVAGR